MIYISITTITNKNVEHTTNSPKIIPEKKQTRLFADIKKEATTANKQKKLTNQNRQKK